METDEERAKRFLVMDGDYYSPKMLGFERLEDMMMDRAYYIGLYGDHIYNGVKVKELK